MQQLIDSVFNIKNRLFKSCLYMRTQRNTEIQEIADDGQYT